MFISPSATALLEGCKVVACQATLGGGIANHGILTISRSTVQDNHAEYG